MEEILASIRRIIADDDAKTAIPASIEAAKPPALAAAASMPVLPVSPTESLPDTPPATPRPTAAPEPEPADILELTEEMRAPEPEPAPEMRFRTVDAQPDVIFSDTLPESAKSEPGPDLMESEDRDPITELPADDHLSDSMDNRLDDPLEDARRTLSQQMQSEQPLLSRSATAAVDSAFASLAHTVLSQNARTLDDLVKEMLRPMLKTWLDDNLPSLVERLVRAEIERVSRGR